MVGVPKTSISVSKGYNKKFLVWLFRNHLGNYASELRPLGDISNIPELEKITEDKLIETYKLDEEHAGEFLLHLPSFLSEITVPEKELSMAKNYYKEMRPAVGLTTHLGELPPDMDVTAYKNLVKMAKRRLLRKERDAAKVDIEPEHMSDIVLSPGRNLSPRPGRELPLPPDYDEILNTINQEMTRLKLPIIRPKPEQTSREALMFLINPPPSQGNIRLNLDSNRPMLRIGDKDIPLNIDINIGRDIRNLRNKQAPGQDQNEIRMHKEEMKRRDMEKVKQILMDLYEKEINVQSIRGKKFSDYSDEFIRTLLNKYKDVGTLNLMYLVMKHPEKRRYLTLDEFIDIQGKYDSIKHWIRNGYIVTNLPSLSGGYDKPIKRRKKVKRKSVKRKSSKRKQRKSVKRKSSRSRKQTKRKSSRSRKQTKRKSSKRR